MFPKKKIKILECIRQGQIGGGESHLLSLVENIDRNIYEPVILSFTDGPMIDRLKEMNILTYIIPTEKPFDIRVWKKVAALLLKEKVDIVHCHGSRAMSNVFKAAKKVKVPLVYTIHGWSFHEDQHPLLKRVRIMGEKFLTARADLNIAVSESNMQTGSTNFSHFKAIVINNGINQQKFNPAKKFKNIRQEINISEQSILLLFIARFTFQKQPLSLIKSFAQAQKYNPALQLLMVGDGEEKMKAHEIVKQLQLEDKVHFLPFRQDVPDLLAACDIFVLPSLWEGLPIGLLEAMSMGKSVIATNVDGTMEVVKNDFNGLLIETSNLVDNLTEAINNLSANVDLRKRLAENALQTVTDNFNATTMTRKIEKEYSKIILHKEVLA
jgi:glycosyltransferase involved in cell wall biosynthesis